LQTTIQGQLKIDKPGIRGQYLGEIRRNSRSGHYLLPFRPIVSLGTRMLWPR